MAARTVDGFIRNTDSDFPDVAYDDVLDIQDVRRRLIEEQIQVIEALIDKAEQDFPDIDKAVRRANFYASDQAGRIHRDIMKTRAVKTGAVGFEWTRTKSKNPREDHLALVGRRFRWGEEPVLPGTLPNCKCGMKPLYPKDFAD